MKKIKAEIVSIQGSKATIKFKQYDSITMSNINIKQFVAGPGLKAWFIPEAGSIVDYCENDDGDTYVECGAWYNDNNTEPFSGSNSKCGIEFPDGTQVYWEKDNYVFNLSDQLQIKKVGGAITKINYGTTDLIQWMIDLSTQLTGNLGVPIVMQPTHLAKLTTPQLDPANKIEFE